MIIATSRYWDEIINMNDEAKVEIKFWLNNCQSLPQKRFFAKKLLPDKIVYTDASSFPCECFAVETYTRVVHKMWSSEEALKSSTYRELKAVFITLFSLQDVFQNRLVKIYTDNQNVVRITNAGSMKSELQSLAIEILIYVLEKNISIEVEWIPSKQNLTADAYSKVFDYGDWSISDKFFDFFNKLWGPFTCDLLTDTNNH
jgi:ribonuclease HI